jgi:hypothetical protein
MHHQRKLKSDLFIILYLDIKNAFNAVHHQAIFFILEACGFPEADIALLYDGLIHVMSNKFGTCILY